MSASIYMVTIAAGIVYMKALAALLNQNSELVEVNLKGAINSILQDKSTMGQIITEANEEYENAKASGELEKENKTVSKLSTVLDTFNICYGA